MDPGEIFSAECAAPKDFQQLNEKHHAEYHSEKQKNSPDSEAIISNSLINNHLNYTLTITWKYISLFTLNPVRS